MTKQEILESLGLADENSGVFAGEWLEAGGDTLEVINPTTGEHLANVTLATLDDYEKVVASSTEAFDRWRMLPAPKRGEYVRQIGNALDPPVAHQLPDPLQHAPLVDLIGDLADDDRIAILADLLDFGLRLFALHDRVLEIQHRDLELGVGLYRAKNQQRQYPPRKFVNLSLIHI